jgi:TolB protein
MNADGTNQRRLVFELGTLRSPRWSPDGQYIMFSADRVGNFDLYLIHADGLDLRQITFDPADDFNGDWQP